MCATLAVSTVASADESDATLESSTSYVTIYRLYNPYSGEHLYTESKDEYDYLGKIGWRQESVAWNSPSKSNTPVYRLYNRYSGEHHYTTSWKEYSYLGSIGWTQEDVSFWSYDADGTTGTTTYRLFNAYETVGTHHYTTSKKEYDYLSSIGWKPEGVCWYGAPESTPVTATYKVSFNTNGGSAVSAQTVQSGKTATQPANPTKSGYKFDGWYSDSALTKSFNFSTPITANTTLYAKWLQTYAVTFNYNGGSAVAKQTVENDKKAAKPANPTKTDNEFVAWFSDEGLTMPYNFTSEVSSNLTLYAKWQSNALPAPNPPESAMTVYRLINQTTGNYLYTVSEDEIASKVENGWVNEGVAWYAPENSGTPIYRLNHLDTGEYHFTTSRNEYDYLQTCGWTAQGVVFYSENSSSAAVTTVTVYRLFNPYSGVHFYTASNTEKNNYAAWGWKDEGIAFYGVE